jgi:prepilin-type processing-associated H-X9-DG protein
MVACQSNLRQIAHGFLLYANASRGKLPPLSENQPPSGGNPITSGGKQWYEFLGENGHVPVGEADLTGTRGYVTGVWRCPSVSDDEINPLGSYGWGGGYGVHSLQTFRYDQYTNPATAPKRLGGPKLSRVLQGTEKWLVGDTGRPAGTTGVWRTWVGTFSPPFDAGASGSNTNQPACRHAGRANVAFFDGHVDGRSLAELNEVPGRIFPSKAEADGY